MQLVQITALQRKSSVFFREGAALLQYQRSKQSGRPKPRPPSLEIQAADAKAGPTPPSHPPPGYEAADAKAQAGSIPPSHPPPGYQDAGQAGGFIFT